VAETFVFRDILIIGKKVKGHPRTGHGGPEGKQKYSSILS
jgi:hypothetical protein